MARVAQLIPVISTAEAPAVEGSATRLIAAVPVEQIAEVALPALKACPAGDCGGRISSCLHSRSQQELAGDEEVHEHAGAVTDAGDERSRGIRRVETDLAQQEGQ